MIRLFWLGAFFLLTEAPLYAQAYLENTAAGHWADSVMATLSLKDRIAQLMIVRASDPSRYYLVETAEAVKRYHVGGLCFFQGGPLRQAMLTNDYQQISHVPLFIAQDAEWGLGMRLDSVGSFVHQMMIGATSDAGLAERVGVAVGDQCKRMGVQVDFAPDIDVNNNPDNPVINDRSFGENKYTVARYGAGYAKGLQAEGVMACAKHFPGHGDTRTDSHLDLPVIDKSVAQLDSLELYPFRVLAAQGVGSMMVAHLYLPAIDNREHRPSSLSYNSVTGLLRNDLGYKGLVFTDALDMKGVSKYFPAEAAGPEALMAGNDMLCLPSDIPATLHSVKKAIRKHKISREDINGKVKKVLMAKYAYGLADLRPVDTAHLVIDLNRSTKAINREIAVNALTLLRLTNSRVFPLLPLPDESSRKVAFVGIGLEEGNLFSQLVKERYGADTFYFPYGEGENAIPSLVNTLKGHYDAIVIGVHRYSRKPQGQYGLSGPALHLLNELQTLPNAITFVFGNPYAIRYFPGMPNLLACYEDDTTVQAVAADMLQGHERPRGLLPVSISDSFPSGSGIVGYAPLDEGLNMEKLRVIDSLADDAIARHATPGCEVLVARNGKIVWNKAYGYLNYDKAEGVKTDDLYDLASVTKICATTVSVMKLYDEEKIDLDKCLGDYLPWLKGTNKERLKIKDVMLHQAGLKAFIPFYKDVSTKTGDPKPGYFADREMPGFEVRVAENMYMRNDYVDTMYRQIAESDLGPLGKYLYSDNDFILMGKVVEAVSGMTLDQYALKNFYIPLGMTGTGFHPRDHYPLERIAPTEEEKHFRRQLIRGDVHDPGAAMFGGVSGHAGLFSDAYDLSVLLQMLLNGGEMNGERYIRDSTIRYFTAYNRESSRRGIGFDKPEKDNISRKDPYPCASASPDTYGHTGFTGTCIWVDPKYNLVFVFLSNRVCPDGDNNRLSKLNVRSNIQEAIYKAME